MENNEENEEYVSPRVRVLLIRGRRAVCGSDFKNSPSRMDWREEENGDIWK